MNTLPLSWSYSNKSYSEIRSVRKNNFEWLSLINASSDFSLSDLRKLNESERSIIIRGCNIEHKRKLEECGFSFSQVGLEAILLTDYNHFAKRSLKNLIYRGKRNGKIMKINYSSANQRKLIELHNETVHGQYPRLKYLFQSEFGEDNLLYAFVDKNNIWLGAVLLSKNSPRKLQTELLLRRKNAPIGVMETLVEYCFSQAKQLGYAQLSLGEVPFISKEKTSKGVINKLFMAAGKVFGFAYNYRGLYNFKNKFQPFWESVFICSNNKIGIGHFYFMFVHSQFYKLVLEKIKIIVKKRFDRKYSPSGGIFIFRKLDFIKT